MCYRQTAHYVVLCDRCGLAAPEGTGWWTPSIADQAALQAGWEMTSTEHLCPACLVVDLTDDAGTATIDRPPLPPPVGAQKHPDISWPPAPATATHSWEESL